jgi:hypothetical protein
MFLYTHSWLVTLDQINAVLGSNGPLRRLLLNHYRRDRGHRASDDDDDEYMSGYGGFGPRRRRPKVTGERFPKIPSVQGQALMDSGLYGCNEYFVDRRRKRKNNVSERLLWRKLGLDARGSSRRANRYIAQVCALKIQRIPLLTILLTGYGAQHNPSRQSHPLRLARVQWTIL